MRYQGKITNWKDDQGFGFVILNGGGQKAFVHIKSFANSSHRPINGDIITYELASDERSRFFAKNIRFAGETTKYSDSKKSSSLSTSFLIVFGFLFATLGLLGRLPQVIVGLYLIASIVTFLVYAKDKSAAQNSMWRISESRLHLLSLIGGWLGALLAQKILRHKSKKEEFQAIFWVTVFMNCCVLVWLLVTKDDSIF